MSIEILIDSESAELEIIERNGNKLRARVDNKEYNLDLVMVENGVYSIILDGMSYNVELVQAEHSKKYDINTYKRSYQVEIIDAESKYARNRKKSLMEGSENSIASPMPGKVVKIPVSEGDEIKAGETVIIVSAMKMENEYKSTIDGKVKKIMVKEGDTVDSNQPLVLLE